MTDNDLIVVGVDGTEGGRRALRWAVAEARRTGSAVEAVTVWTWDGIEGAMQAATSPIGEREHAERISLREVAAVLAEFGTSTPVVRKVVEGRTVPVLVGAARSARMLVLGSHGYGRFHHAVVGSTSEECIRVVRCPVVIIPAPRHVKASEAAQPIPVS